MKRFAAATVGFALGLTLALAGGMSVLASFPWPFPSH
jgi:hypothetical protein